MLKKIILICLCVILTLIVSMAVFLFYAMKGPDISKYQYLREPQISQCPNQKVLVVEAKGDPNAVGAKAFGLLYKIYYKVVKGGKMQTPRARWPQDLGTQIDEWMGQYALPVPDYITELPDLKTEPSYSINLTTWEYGTVAEILHVGPYSKEPPTIKKLKKYIHDNGYYLIGLHEEEYLKGPGMFGRGDPQKYQTIIRYRIAKVVTDSTKK